LYFEPPKSKNCTIEFKLYLKDTNDQDFFENETVIYTKNSDQNKPFVNFKTKLINKYNAELKVCATVTKQGHNKIENIDFGKIYKVPFPSECFFLNSN